MTSGMTPAKRFLVRTSLITGSTLATIIGAQGLVMVDTNANNAFDIQADSDTSVDGADTIIIIAPAGQPTTDTVSTVPTATTPAPTPTQLPPTATTGIVSQTMIDSTPTATLLPTSTPTATLVPPTVTPLPTQAIVQPQQPPRRTRSSR
ncbi:MAG: hypothetical protein U0694_24660 [Anaerolineae bacterium]